VQAQIVFVGTNEGTQFVAKLVDGVPGGTDIVNIGNTGLFGQAVIRDAASGNVCVYTVSGGGELRLFQVNEALPEIQPLSTMVPGPDQVFYVPVMHPSQPFLYIVGDGLAPAPPPPAPPPPPVPMPFVAAYTVDPATCGVTLQGSGLVPASPGPPIDVLATPR
jgi:hypothetical protein